MSVFSENLWNAQSHGILEATRDYPGRRPTRKEMAQTGVQKDEGQRWAYASTPGEAGQHGGSPHKGRGNHLYNTARGPAACSSLALAPRKKRLFLRGLVPSDSEKSWGMGPPLFKM